MTKVLKEVDPAAIADLKAYAKKYAKLPTVGGDGLKARANNHVAVWILALWNLRKTEGPTIELSSISPRWRISWIPDSFRPSMDGKISSAP